MKVMSPLLVFLSAILGLAAADRAPIRIWIPAESAFSGDTIGYSTLSRSATELNANVQISSLPRGVYTVWFVTFDQNDANEAPHVRQGSHIIAENDITPATEITFDMDATMVGNAPINCGLPGYPSFNPLANLNARVLVIVVNHGIPDDFDNVPAGWITNHWEGEVGICGNDCTAPPPEGTQGNGWCPDYAAAEHTVDVGASDDPHIKKWDGTYYDYMGACDLKLVQAPNFGLEDKNQTLDVDIRTKIRYDYSFIESAAIKIGQETLEVGSWGDYALNGVTSVALPATLSGYPVTHEMVNDKTQIFTVHLDDTESVLVKVFKDWVSVKLDQPSRRRFHGSVGMMGELETGRLLARDGVTELTDPNVVAAEWQIRDDEPMLFRSTREPRYPQECQLPTAEKKSSLRRRLGESVVSREEAKAACEDAEMDNLEGCIHDVMVMTDLDLVAAGAF